MKEKNNEGKKKKIEENKIKIKQNTRETSNCLQYKHDEDEQGEGR